MRALTACTSRKICPTNSPSSTAPAGLLCRGRSVGVLGLARRSEVSFWIVILRVFASFLISLVARDLLQSAKLRQKALGAERLPSAIDKKRGHFNSSAFSPGLAQVGLLAALATRSL
ncbi:hypothetical protein EVAR_81007_1 [Eumeta japonica]|uniref:Uncharacterized protein n=1 Tax=Eumeta variegata TaxID=151549 RepID=A0A4C1T691_EUMVA|nr:hypothetical protein EVAR_81007_1 [Eumeta japonica]